MLSPRRITFTPAGSPIVVERMELETSGFLNRFHRRRGYQQPYAADLAMAISVDAVIVAMVFWALSGLWMWWEMRATRWWGLACAADRHGHLRFLRADDMTFAHFVRRAHLYTGLFLLPWVIMFGVSTIPINHQSPEPRGVDAYRRAAIRRAGARVGRKPAAARPPDDDRCRHRGGYWVYRVNPRQVQVGHPAFPRARAPQLLHLREPRWSSSGGRFRCARSSRACTRAAGTTWAASGTRCGPCLSTSCASGLILWIASGIYMWWGLPSTRRWGWMALGAGVFCFARDYRDALMFDGPGALHGIQLLAAARRNQIHVERPPHVVDELRRRRRCIEHEIAKRQQRNRSRSPQSPLPRSTASTDCRRPASRRRPAPLAAACGRCIHRPRDGRGSSRCREAAAPGFPALRQAVADAERHFDDGAVVGNRASCSYTAGRSSAVSGIGACR